MKRTSIIKKIERLVRKIGNCIQKNPRKAKKIGILSFSVIAIILLFIIVTVIFVEESHKQKYVVYNGKNLKEEKYPGYQERIDELREKHPNWTFTLFYTKLDWNEVIENEGHSDNRKNPRNLIPDSSKYPEDWKCEIDKDKTFDNGTWLCASHKAIAYQMDPRNILNDENIFQFAKLQYVEGAQTKEGIEEITEGSFLEGDSIAEALVQAGKDADIDPYFIASRLIQEQGRDGTTMSKGYEYEGTIVYNPFNINATGDGREEILKNAAQYAYEQGWNTLEKGLLGGVSYVKEDYIDKGQNTLYLQKFDVVNQDNSLYRNQYMQNLLAPQSEGSNMLKIYQSSRTVDSKLNFIIPLYENMPKEIAES